MLLYLISRASFTIQTYFHKSDDDSFKGVHDVKYEILCLDENGSEYT